MKFEIIPKSNAQKIFGHVHSSNEFYCFIKDFSVIGVKWSQPTNISASYFFRILQDGSSARPRGYGKSSGNEHDESSTQLNEFYRPLLDHGALWKLKNGNVICTAMPYGDLKSITKSFDEMVKKFHYPDTIKMQVLDDKYRFRQNGDCMIIIYCDVSLDECQDDYLYEELREKAIKHSGPGLLRYQKSTGQYIRDQFVSKFAKKRAQGICQLCNSPAPFKDRDGKPFLETHHIVPLSKGGDDSVENTVALCPNCHRKMHVLNLKEDVEKLIELAVIDSSLCDE